MKILTLLFIFLISTTLAEKACVEDDECNSNEYCDFDTDYLNGECKAGCRSDESCNENEICDFSTRNCEIECLSHDQCNKYEYCDFNEKQCKIGCKDDKVCEPDEYCEMNSRICLKGCQSKESCGTKHFCDYETRKCKYGCAFSWDCDAEEYCDMDNNLCLPGCDVNYNCKNDEFCYYEEHKCVGVCENSTCGENSKCSAFNHNQYCSCIDGYFPEGGIGCRTRTESDNLDNQTCSMYCSKYGDCTFQNESVYCFCPQLALRFYNPYNDCVNLIQPLSSKIVAVLIQG